MLFGDFLLCFCRAVKVFRKAILFICNQNKGTFALRRSIRAYLFYQSLGRLDGGAMAHIYGILHHRKPVMQQQFSKSGVSFTLDFCLCRQIKNSHYPHNAPTVRFHIQTVLVE